jgi:hypothetical protein
METHTANWHAKPAAQAVVPAQHPLPRLPQGAVLELEWLFVQLAVRASIAPQTASHRSFLRPTTSTFSSGIFTPRNYRNGGSSVRLEPRIFG